MIVYVLDRRFMQDASGPPPGTVRYQNGRAEWVHSRDRAVVALEGLETLGKIVDYIQAAVRARGQGERSIWKLVLCGHGNADHISLGAERLNESNARALAPLAAFMTPGGSGVELHSCYSASSSGMSITHHRVTPIRNARGEILNLTQGNTQNFADGMGMRVLKAIASAVRAPVTGSVDEQLFERRYQIEGRRVTVRPDGSFTPARP